MWPPVNSRNRERGNEFVPSKMENSMEREKKEQNRKNTRKAVLYTFIRRRGDYTTIKRRIGVGEPSTFYDNENGKIHKNFQKEQSETPGNQKKKKKKKVKCRFHRTEKEKDQHPVEPGVSERACAHAQKSKRKLFVFFGCKIPQKNQKNFNQNGTLRYIDTSGAVNHGTNPFDWCRRASNSFSSRRKIKFRIFWFDKKRGAWTQK
jgi:hypothetical protein